jgi:hypothetical protein
MFVDISSILQNAQNWQSKRMLDKLAAQPAKVTYVSSAQEGIYRVLNEDRTAFVFDQSQLTADLESILTPAQSE